MLFHNLCKQYQFNVPITYMDLHSRLKLSRHRQKKEMRMFGYLERMCANMVERLTSRVQAFGEHYNIFAGLEEIRQQTWQGGWPTG
jgi:hypothetical protein